MTKICCISDTHSHHRQLVIPEADVLIHAGDICWKGELSILEDFCFWMKELPIKNKVLIFGNHETGFERGPKRQIAIEMVKGSGIHYLEDSGIEIDGIKYWGSPVQPFFCDWEFNRQRGKDIKKHWDKIPSDTNVIITHGPPMGMLDEAPRGFNAIEHVGCQDLLNKLCELPDLKLHTFGHIHAAYGQKQVGHTMFVNASSCTESYTPTNPPIVVEI